MKEFRSRLVDLDALVLTASIWFLAKFLRYAFPPLFPTFRDTYHVSDAVLGAAFTAMMLVYAAMQFPAGAIADRLGAVRVIVTGGVIAVAAAFFLAVEGPFPVVVAGMVLVGAGTGLHKTVAVRLLSGLYPERTGRALGVLDTFGTFGGIVAPAAVVVVADVLRWNAIFLAAGLFGLVLLATFRRRVDDEGIAWKREAVPFRRYVGLFTDPRIAVFSLGTVAFSFTYNGVVAFLPLYLVDAGGLTEGTANLLYGALFVVSAVQLLSGDVSDRYGELRVIVGSIGLASVGLVLLVLGDGLVILALAVVGFGLGSHGFRPVRGAYLMRVLPETAAGGGFGVFRTVLMVAGAVSPAIVGTISDAGGPRIAFAVLAASLVLGFGTFTLLALTGD